MAGETVAVVEETLDIPQNQDDIFSAAFDQLSVAADTARNAPEGVVPPEPPVEEPVVKVEEPVVKVEEPVVKTAPTEPTPPIPQQRMSDEEIARIAAIASQVQQPRRQEVQSQPQEPQIFTQDDLAFLQNYQNEYSDIARGEALLRRKDILDAVRFIFSEVNKAVAPTQAIAQQLMARTHLGDVERLVPEGRLTREEAVDWAKKQPSFLQPAYYRVIQEGNAEEIAAMTAMVRGSVAAPGHVAGNGANAAGVVPVRPGVQAVQETPAQKKALAALKPVETKRSGISTEAIEPNDFGGAFERFAAQADAERAAQQQRVTR